jgi:protein-tyrosine kinase
MSKIHDALKKAQEVVSRESPALAQRGSTETQAAPAPNVVEATTVAERRSPVLEAFSSGISGQYLRFEDLLKQCAEPVWQPDPQAIVFSGSYGPSQGAEQFRTLRTRLYQLRDLSPLKKLLITSSIAAEGKTFVATNLAQAFAREQSRRVLLIDGDLRNARLHLPLAAPLSPGLAEYLRGEASEADIIQHGQPGNLCFIAGGNGGGTNASELLSNERLPKLLERIAPLFDWVIVDSPPCLPVADASVLAGFTDGLLLVVRAESTPSAMVQKARQELRKRNVIGVVLNGVEEFDSYGRYYTYGYGDNSHQGQHGHKQQVQ